MKKRATRFVTVLCTAVMGMGGMVASQVGTVLAAPVSEPNMYAVFQGIRNDSNIALGSGIELNSLQFGMSNSGNVASQTKGAGVGKVVISDITFTKRVDLSTPAIMEEVAMGRQISGDIYLQKTINQRRVTYLHLHLVGVFTGESQSSGGDIPSEAVSIAPSILTYTYTSYNAEGTPSRTLTFTWDAPSQRGSLSGP